ncbi:DUF2652 domain-containing protein [Chitinophaga filiformis]|uniref:DUF2652 domain-containing protein n=1 Tax=Chitinophaga filiformis TaxID=104663 RepID=A0A1G7M9G4_CHIFI|nr:DUF2652 domain-containing protein [Chitinophaga filiformis]SDF58361.1 Protein of unknown function [Chitinophaga filiformis]
MENKGLLFIPDISGFTRFVNEIEIDHSRHIIQQLLEVLINANNTGLEISEIEGDAILFYKFGEPLELEALYKQVERMFCEFHRHLNAYDSRKICQCRACVSAVGLTLKVITHYGEFTTYNVKNFSKLIGKDVIVAHQLLKNDIAQHEYWLVTDNLLQDTPPTGLATWMKWDASAKQTETGEIPFHYTQLSQLREELPPEPDPQLELSDKVKVVSVFKDYDVDIKTLCFTVVHFEFRHQWQIGLKEVNEVEHFLPGVGSRHQHVMENGQKIMMFTSSFYYNPEEKILFSETDEKRKSSTYYTITKAPDGRSRLILDIYIPKNPVRQLLFNLFERNALQANLRESLNRLEPIVKEMVLPLEF